MNHRNAVASIFVLGMLLSTSPHAHAVTKSYTFSGTVDFVSDPPNIQITALMPALQHGDSFSGAFSFDDDVAGEPEFFAVRFPGATNAISATFVGTNSVEPSGVTYLVERSGESSNRPILALHGPGGGIRMDAWHQDTPWPATAFDPNVLIVDMAVFAQDFEATELPTTLGGIDYASPDFDLLTLRVTLHGPDPFHPGEMASRTGNFNITSITAVPEPSSLVLFALGAVVLIAVRRRSC